MRSDSHLILGTLGLRSIHGETFPEIILVLTLELDSVRTLSSSSFLHDLRSWKRNFMLQLCSASRVVSITHLLESPCKIHKDGPNTWAASRLGGIDHFFSVLGQNGGSKPSFFVQVIPESIRKGFGDQATMMSAPCRLRDVRTT